MVKVIHTSGKRKTAIARGTVREGTGKVRINKVPLELYSPELANLKLQEPLTLAGDLANDVDINIHEYYFHFLGILPRLFLKNIPTIVYSQVSTWEINILLQQYLVKPKSSKTSLDFSPAATLLLYSSN